MLTLNLIRENSQRIIERLKVRNIDPGPVVNDILKLDESRRKLQGDVNARQNEMNTLSKSIGILFREGKTEEAEKAKTRTGEIKEQIKNLHDNLERAEKELNASA